MSQRTAQKELGISNVNEERARVAAAIEDLEQIKVAVNQIVESKESSSLSFLVLSSSDSEESGNDTGDDEDDVDAENNARSDENRDSASDSMDFESTEQTPVHSPNSNTQRSDSTMSVDEFTKNQSMPSYAPSNDHLLYILRDNNLNWISFVEEVRITFTMTEEALNQLFIDFAHFISFADLTEEEEKFVEQSRQAYLMQRREREREDETREFDEIITDSESDDQRTGYAFKRQKMLKRYKRS